MKKLLTTLLIFIWGPLCVSAQQINTIEYYFDTDPGFGQGRQITTGANTLDADFAFDLSGLSTGMHTLFTRLKNSDNKWSSIYQGSIYILNGIAGTAQIVRVEYYFDTDPGFGNGTAINLATESLDSTLQFNITGLSVGMHTCYVRLKNNSNSWSTVYQGNVFVANGENTGLITAAEYFFDADPGYGNGTQLTFNSFSLDSGINCNVTALQPGIHTFYIRIRNSDNNWSFVNQGNFIVSAGDTGTAKIQTLHYFIDSTTNTITIPLNSTALLDTTLSFAVPDNGTEQRVLGLQLLNNNGSEGDATLNDISLCDLYKPQGGFSTVRFANSYSFIDSSKYNNTKKIIWKVNDIADTIYNNSPVFNYNMPAGFRGAKKITQIIGAGCRRDTVEELINTDIIEYVSPHVGTYGSDLVINIFGGDLDTTATIYLQHESTIVYPYDKSIFAYKMLNLIFDFHDIQYSMPYPDVSHKYDLHIHYQNGYDTVLVGSVTLWDPWACLLAEFEPVALSAGRARESAARRRECEQLKDFNNQDIEADLTGPDNIRTGVWNDYSLHLTNRGHNIAKEFPYWLLIPAQDDVEFNLTFIPPAPFGDSVSIDSLPPLYIAIDTVIENVRYQYKLYGFYFPYLSPGETRDIDFRIRTTNGAPQAISYWLQKAMFGSPWDNDFFACLWDGSGYVPVVGCATGVVDFFRNRGGFGKDYKSNMSKGALYEAMHASGVLFWSVAGVGLSCGGVKHAAGATKLSIAALAKITKWEEHVDKMVNTINNQLLGKCIDLLKQWPGKIKKIVLYYAFDPNSITGNSQFDTSLHFIDNYSQQHYTVNFENKPTASAAAQHVLVTDTLNKNKFDFKTFSFTGYRIGDSLYMVPQFRRQISQTTGIKNTNNLQVQFIGSFDTATGIVKCDFYTMDSSGKVPVPETSLQGFLPPNMDGRSGTGRVEFKVLAKELGTLDTFSNKATIYFDNNEPIVTNEWINTVDTTAPTGRITNAVPVNDSMVKLTIEHSDIGSGFHYNSFYLKNPGDTVFSRIANSSSDTVLFTGTPGQTYQLFTKAVDNVGNMQAKGAVADITFTLNAVIPVHLISFTGNKNGEKIRLKWTTTNEINMLQYGLEKSRDGSGFETIAKVKAAGSSLVNYYQQFDDHPFTVNNYYRLKMIESDNSYRYSNTIRIDFGKKYSLNISPDPAHDYVVISGSEYFTLLQFIDISGKTVKQFTKLQNNTFNISNLNAGMYFIRLSSNEDVQVLKFFKQ